MRDRTSRPPASPQPVVVRRVRILGLAGAAPTAEAVRAALGRALGADATAEPSRDARPASGGTLDQAAQRVALTIRSRLR